MTTLEVSPLTAEVVDRLPDPCRGCLFWEDGHPRPDQHRPQDRREEALARKQQWCRSQAVEAGPPGRIVTVGDDDAGFVLFGHAWAFVARRAPAPTLSADALLLATLWVDPRFRERGLGRRLLQAAVKEAIRRGLGAVEVYGDRRFRERDCLLPATWLLREGFVVHREHPRYPLFRLETRRTARWTDQLGHAWDEVTGRLPRLVPQRAPTPVRQGPAAPLAGAVDGLIRRRATGGDRSPGRGSGHP